MAAFLDYVQARGLGDKESKDVYQLFLERTGRASMIITSNRDTAEWLAMFDDVLLAQSAVARFKNTAYDSSSKASRIALVSSRRSTRRPWPPMRRR